MGLGWGIDVGVASLGFAVLDLDEAGQPQEIVDGVAHVYDAPTGAVERRLFRSMRRQNQRRRRRLATLKAALVQNLGLDPGFDQVVPDDETVRKGHANGGLSRVRPRALGLEVALSPEDLGRALMHLARNRGRRLSRGLRDARPDDAPEPDPKAGTPQDVKKGRGAKKAKADPESPEGMAAAARRTQDLLAALGRELGQGEPATPGQWLRREEERGNPTRQSRHTPDTPVFTRRMMQDEARRLLEAQASFHPGLTAETRASLFGLIFHEETTDGPRVGKCRYRVRGPDGAIEDRLPLASDLFQTKRILEEIAHLVTLTDPITGTKEPLTLAQRDGLRDKALAGEDLTAAKVRAWLKLGRSAEAPVLGLEVAAGAAAKKAGKGRKTEARIAGHALAKAFREAGAHDLWHGASLAERDRLACLLRTVDDREELTEVLEGEFGLEAPVAAALAQARVPQGYSAAGATATRHIIEQMQAEVIPVSEAVRRAGLRDALGTPEEDRPPRTAPLPYYGEVLPEACMGGTGEPGDPPEKRFGRVPNPVVHVALNRLRVVANEFLKRYGPPDRIGLELARDMHKSIEEREAQEKENQARQKENDRRAEMLISQGLPATRDALKMMRLWEWQKHKCLYTGQEISLEDLGRGVVEVDHILPWAETMDDRMGNLALCLREVNAFKGKRAPHAAFYPRFPRGDGRDRDYAHLLKQVQEDRPGSLWRFEPDALERVRGQERFQERFLNDTRYVGKLARAYLARLVPRESDVLCLNGAITAQLRRQWGCSTLIREIMIDEGRLDPDLFAPQGDPPADEAARAEHAKALAERVRARGKIRWDDRHHLLDAIVAGCVTRSDVQRLQTLSARGVAGEDAATVLAGIRRGVGDAAPAGFCWRPDFSPRVKAFLTTLTPEQPTRVTRKPDHDPKGALHKQTQLGVICENPDRPGLFVTLARQEVAALGAPCKDRAAFQERLEERLGIGGPARAALAAAVKAGRPVWWGRQKATDPSDAPLAALGNLERANTQLQEALLAAWDRAAETLDDKGKPKSGPLLAREAVAEVLKQAKQYRFTRVEHQKVRVLRRNKDGRPCVSYVTGSNHALVCFKRLDGSPDLEVITTLDANDTRFVPTWRRLGGHLLFTLQQGDLVEMTPPSLRSDDEEENFWGGNAQFTGWPRFLET
ncbi:type II CRISPR RNA-guided endonuclease Cas9 [Pararhodospirillum oryzae]|uniref:HNH Cas9-type domain-containing protein n=1 Tax=Pararhodospirillum oryzae TaxID=478448 RepID=A0A512H6D3_9PROT|nr:type II CRISPR RNA-guided endonuclease Cas9 [Pararhodospirillum oryzae]GEO80950.1 hypothetical protein ROR02_10810 [Pararhodospirillum oryzae]